ncbi:TPA: FRG domain-containing protein, partial [Escherichia coli]
MFNLIIGGEPSVFDRWPSMDPNIKNGEDSFSLSRMLEGTPSLLYKKLTPVSPITLDALSKLPVLFMTEIYDKDGDKNRYLRVRLGKVGNLHIDNDDVCYHFEIV